MPLSRWGIVLSLCLLLCGCSTPQHDESFQVSPDVPGLVLTAEEDSISPTGLTLRFDNDAEDPYGYGAWYRLERRTIWGTWQAVAPITVWQQNDWLHVISPGESETMTYSWDRYYGELPDGKYRIIIDMNNEKVIYISNEGDEYTNTDDRYYLTAEFAIS